MLNTDLTPSQEGLLDKQEFLMYIIKWVKELKISEKEDMLRHLIQVGVWDPHWGRGTSPKPHIGLCRPFTIFKKPDTSKSLVP